MVVFTNAPFIYDRTHPPLFFHGGSGTAPTFTNTAYRQISKEFHAFLKTDKSKKARHWTVLSNGMTMGEFSMYYLTQKNRQRKENNY